MLNQRCANQRSFYQLNGILITQVKKVLFIRAFKTWPIRLLIVKHNYILITKTTFSGGWNKTTLKAILYLNLNAPENALNEENYHLRYIHVIYSFISLCFFYFIVSSCDFTITLFGGCIYCDRYDLYDDSSGINLIINTIFHFQILKLYRIVIFKLNIK